MKRKTRSTPVDHGVSWALREAGRRFHDRSNRFWGTASQKAGRNVYKCFGSTEISEVLCLEELSSRPSPRLLLRLIRDHLGTLQRHIFASRYVDLADGHGWPRGAHGYDLDLWILSDLHQLVDHD